MNCNNRNLSSNSLYLSTPPSSTDSLPSFLTSSTSRRSSRRSSHRPVVGTQQWRNEILDILDAAIEIASVPAIGDVTSTNRTVNNNAPLRQ